MGISPRHGSHVAALIALDCDWTEVSLYHCAGHRALAATRVSGAALCRSVMDQCLSGFLIQGTSWRKTPIAFNHSRLRRGTYLKYCYSIFKELNGVKFTPLLYGDLHPHF